MTRYLRNEKFLVNLFFYDLRQLKSNLGFLFSFVRSFVCLFCFVAILFSDCGLLQNTRICASLGSRMKFKTLCYPVFGKNKNTALPSF